MGCHSLLKGIFLTRDQTLVSCIVGTFFTFCVTRKDYLLIGRKCCSMLQHRWTLITLCSGTGGSHEGSRGLWSPLSKRSGGEEGDRGWDGWMASLTQWTWVQANSGRCWRTGKPGVQQSMGSQRVRHDWETEQQVKSIDTESRLEVARGWGERRNGKPLLMGIDFFSWEGKSYKIDGDGEGTTLWRYKPLKWTLGWMNGMVMWVMSQERG